MELWIRSQDKEALIKVDKIFYWNTCPEMPNTGKHYLGNKEWVGNADYTKLGEYNTKERALEVLDEIQKKLQPSLYIYESKEYDKPKTITDATPSLRIYEMPKE